MAEICVCVCGLTIRERHWHGQVQWTHVGSGSIWCVVQRARPRDDRG